MRCPGHVKQLLVDHLQRVVADGGPSLGSLTILILKSFVFVLTDLSFFSKQKHLKISDLKKRKNFI